MARVFVGLSGGVDSAVSAAVLKEQGYDVTGVFIKIWQPEFIECTWREDRLDAMRVAAHLGIPFREIDLSDEYKKEVVDAMVADYARGITPNPDVACNRAIKFGHFLKWARAEGADFVATGHYARIETEHPKFGFRKSKYLDLRNPNMLLRGRDANKDQSYFLYRLTQEQLAYALFPIGDLKKSDVRALAKKYGLPNAERPDSQGICFLGEVTMEEFLARYIPLSRGAVLDMRGETIGEHAGAALYTVGQRHGFTFWNEGDKKYPERAQRVEGVAQQYVTSIDTRANTITVSENKLDAARKEVVLRETHWINSVELPLRAEAEARYRETPVPVSVGKYGDDVIVTFGTPHIAAAGQSIVLYSGDTCHGGGIIC